jgi:hypothetical protein
LKTHLQNEPIYLNHEIYPPKMHDLRDIVSSLRDKFQVAKIISDTQTVHSLHKYMRKFRAQGIQKIERMIFILSFLYIIYFLNFFFSNGVTDGWNFGRMDEYFRRRI